MKPETIKSKTGRNLHEWISIITAAGIGENSHKEIAAFLSANYKISLWWAQELTVLYEKESGKRVTGQTRDVGFQIGVSKTFPAGLEQLWNIMVIERNLKDITEDCEIFEVTTRHEYSHIRMRWKMTEWQNYSILQIRFTGKESGKTTLTFHQEKLADPQARQRMKLHWQKILQKMACFL